MTVSWIVLTHNRGEIVRKAMMHNFDNAGAVPDELVWVDNGSIDNVRIVMEEFEPEVSILFNKNRGVAKGYNAGLGAARGEYIVITGCDMLMPDGWLKTFLRCMEVMPGIACMYSKPIEENPKRIRGPACFSLDGGFSYYPALPIERRIFPRALLADVGYFPESFGLYGWDDLAWAMTAERVCAERGLSCYVLPHMIAEHLGTEGLAASDGKDGAEYHEFKKREAEDPAKRAEFNRLRELDWPKWSPFL